MNILDCQVAEEQAIYFLDSCWLKGWEGVRVKPKYSWEAATDVLFGPYLKFLKIFMSKSPSLRKVQIITLIKEQ